MLLQYFNRSALQNTKLKAHVRHSCSIRRRRPGSMVGRTCPTVALVRIALPLSILSSATDVRQCDRPTANIWHACCMPHRRSVAPARRNLSDLLFVVTGRMVVRTVLKRGWFPLQRFETRLNAAPWRSSSKPWRNHFPERAQQSCNSQAPYVSLCGRCLGIY